MDNITQEDSEKKAYEISFLLGSEDKIDDIRKLLSQHGVDIAQEFGEKKINLAYPIKHLTQALFFALRVSSGPEEIKLLEKDLRSNKNALRSLIIALPVEKNVRGERAPRPAMPTRRTGVIQREPKARHLSNEAIEKKIEEILQ